MDTGKKESESRTTIYECQTCDYFELIHGGDITKLKEKCSHCFRPIRERLQGHGIYKLGGKSYV